MPHGSLLGLYYKDVTSYPVGYELAVDLFPLDFEEFLWALGIKQEIIDIARDSFKKIANLDNFIINQLNEYFKIYMLIGGMPNAVNEYLKTNNLSNVLKIQKGIINNYLQDVMKFAEKYEKQRIIDVFNSIPMQLAKKNKRFLYADIAEKKGIGSYTYGNSILWLNDAGIINYCYNLSEPALPLATNIRLNTFKIYMRDTGLLISMLEQGTGNAILNDNLYINEGGLLENVFAGEIGTRYDKLMYFERKSKLKIDFMLNLEGIVTAIEVKSGNNKKAKSLDSIIQNYKTVKRYMNFEKDTNIYKDNKGIEHYPLFMAMFI